MKRTLSLLLLLALLSAAITGCITSDPPREDNTTESKNEITDTVVATEGHTDEDDNGRCDDCDTVVVISFDFFGLNDLHGKISDTDTTPGVDELTTYLKAQYAENPNTVVLSAGDMWQGSSESNLTKGLLTTEWMNEIGLVAMTLGNHEFDWSEEDIEANLAIAEFPFLAINIFEKSTNALAPYCTPSVIVEKSGLQIGIIGAIGDCYSSISGDKTTDLFFKNGDELTALVKEEATRLRQNGADLIVYAIHDGHDRSSSGTKTVSAGDLSAYYDPSLSDGYVDLVFEGHTHQSYVLLDGYGVYHLQNGGDHRGISHAEVQINFANGGVKTTSAEFLPAATYTALQDDPIVEALLLKYEEEINFAYHSLGRNSEKRSGAFLKSLVAELYYRAGKEIWGDRYPIVLGGGYISVRSPGSLAVGDVNYAMLQSLFPFDNELVLCSISGADLRSRFLETTNENYYIYLGDIGSIDPDATYYIVTDTYSSTYAPNRLTEIERYGSTLYARDLLAAYVQAGGLTADADRQPIPTELTSIPRIYEIGNALADNESTEVMYLVKGVIVSIDNTTYGNMTIKDTEGNTLYVYGVYSENGSTRYDGMSAPPAVGDTVLLYAVVKKYVSRGNVTVELMNARLMSVE